jgi:hypothetical protein
MLVISLGESKNWYVTLTEKVTIANPYFLFAFTHRVTNRLTAVLLTDISTNKDRYNEFAVTQGTTFNLDAGEYEYTIYAQTSSVNLDPTFANEEVESGILKVQFPITRTSYEVSLTEKIYEIENNQQSYFTDQIWQTILGVTWENINETWN